MLAPISTYYIYTRGGGRRRREEVNGSGRERFGSIAINLVAKWWWWW